MPGIMNLPARAGSLVIEDDEATEVYNLLQDAGKGQGVAVEDDPRDTETKARTIARKFADKIEQIHGAKCRVHVVANGDDEFYGVLSLKPNQGDE